MKQPLLTCAMVLFALATAFCSPVAWAAEDGEVASSQDATGMSDAVRAVGLALAAALTLAVAALATARVQAAVGAGGTGALAEKPELFTSIVVLIAIPETIIILGFVMAYVIFSKV